MRAVTLSLLAASLVSVAFSAVPSPTGACTGQLSRAWLDIVFLVDSSAAMTSHGVSNAEAEIKSVLHQLSPSFYDAYQHSRVGVVVYGSNATVSRPLTTSNSVLSPLPYLNSQDSNLASGLLTAQNLLNANPSYAHHKKVIVIQAATYRPDGENDPATVIAGFKSSGGSIITVYYQQQAGGADPLAGVASNGFSLTSTTDPSGTSLFNSLLHINCFCGDFLTSLSTNSYGSPSSGCVEHVVNFPADWDSAYTACVESQSLLVKADTQATQQKLDSIHGLSTPYWIGLRYDDITGNYLWDDYTWLNWYNFASGQGYGALNRGKCVYSQGGKWYNAPCSGDQAGTNFRYYFCQSAPCATNNDCFNGQFYAPVRPDWMYPTTPEPTTESTTTYDWRTTADWRTYPTEAPSTVSTESPETWPGPTEAPYTGPTESTASPGPTTTYYDEYTTSSYHPDWVNVQKEAAHPKAIQAAPVQSKKDKKAKKEEEIRKLREKRLKHLKEKMERKH